MHRGGCAHRGVALRPARPHPLSTRRISSTVGGPRPTASTSGDIESEARGTGRKILAAAIEKPVDSTVMRPRLVPTMSPRLIIAAETGVVIGLVGLALYQAREL